MLKSLISSILNPLMNVPDTGHSLTTVSRPSLPTKPVPPALPSECATVPGQQIQRVINRVKFEDRNVTVMEQEIIYVDSPAPEPAAPAAVPTTDDLIIINRVWCYCYEAGYGFPFHYPDGTPVSGRGIDEIYRAAYEGRLIINNTIPQIPLQPQEMELWSLANRTRRQRFGSTHVQINNGRILLNG